MADARVRRRVAAEIGDDALREVLARVRGLRDLLRCAATCKRWRRLITDRDFHRRRPCVLAGIFSQDYYPDDDMARRPSASGKDISLYRPPWFLSLHAGLDNMQERLALDSLVAAGTNFHRLFDCARPLAARRGYLLARVLPSFSADVSYGDNHRRRQKLHLAVCRPLLDRTSTHLLPPPPFDMTEYLDRGLKGCAILTAADHTRWDGNLVDHMSPPKFQVLLIYNDHVSGFVCASAYRSDTPHGWSTPVKCCPVFGLTRYGPCTGVIVQGSVHWLFKDETANQMYALNISADTSHVSDQDPDQCQ